jgi:tyrosine decarboxylase/aspartate 1-decarboxylase
LLGLKLIRVRLNAKFQVDLDAVKRAIGRRTVAIGFDFKLPGVRSITIDPHKMGMAPIPAGGILFRDQSLTEAIGFKPPYLSDSSAKQITLLGTRSGAAIVAVWALLKHLGKEGYRRIAADCMALTEKLARDLQEIQGICLVMQPSLNIIGIRSRTMKLQSVADELRKRGWATSIFPGHIRIVIMPHTRLAQISGFVRDLRDVIEAGKEADSEYGAEYTQFDG